MTSAGIAREIARELSVDVVVIGAGFTGLMAATGLQQRGHRVAVLEARDHVGGKSESVDDAIGRRVDTGGQFVCDDMPNVLALIRDQGKRLVLVDHDTPGRAFVGGALSTPDPHEMWRTFQRAERAIEHVADPDVEFLDRNASMGHWLASCELDDHVLNAARAALNGIMCVAVDDLPAAHVIDLARRTPLTRDELQYIVAETMHAVAEQLADDLADAVLLSEPARSIEVDAQGTVTVRATSQHPRQAGLYVGDASLDDETPMLVAFLGGPSSHVWRGMAADERRRALLLRLVEAYGPQASSPISFVERDWPDDQWGGGGYWNVLLDATISDAVDVLLRGAPGVTFASTELADSFPGYIEGAINAGRAAAATVTELLTPHRSVPA